MSGSVKVYSYSKCSTCRKALKFLADQGVDYDEVDITEKPPSKTELKAMLGQYDGELRRLFNTSGLEYRARNLKDKLPKLSESDALAMLAESGKLVKRPFLMIGKEAGAVGFKADEWERLLG